MGRRSQVSLDLARACAQQRHDAAAVNMLLDAECIAPKLVRYIPLVSELATDALEHTVTGDGGSFQVTVYQDEAALLIAVKDDGSDKVPLPAQLTRWQKTGRPRPG